jgi:hypothetical protein
MTHHITKPIRAIHFLALALLMTIGTQVNAAETVMVCDAQQGEKRYYKHIKPLVGEFRVKQKLHGKWSEWPERGDDDYKPPKVNIYDSGAMAVMYASRKLENSDNDVLGVPKNTPLRGVRTATLDFEFGFRTIQTSFSYLDSSGNYTSNQTLKDFEKSKKYSCEILK